MGISLVGPVAKTPSAGGLSLIPGQGTRSHMLQLQFLYAATKDLARRKEGQRVHVLQLRPGAAK